MFSQNAITALRFTHLVVVPMSAGVSEENGAPTFRGVGGLWRTCQATTPKAFAMDPKLMWDFYNYRHDLFVRLEANHGHYAIAAIEVQVPAFTLAIQNSDNLHCIVRSKNLVEFHGIFWLVRCSNSFCEQFTHSQENRQVPILPLPLHCSDCGSFLRPHIVLFGETLESNAIRSAAKATHGSDFFIMAGTLPSFSPLRGCLSWPAKGGAVLKINPERTDLSEALN